MPSHGSGLESPDEDLWNRFAYHRPDEEKATRHEQLRDTIRVAAEAVYDLVPSGREQSVAIKALEDAMMWGNAGIARHDLAGLRLRPPRAPA
jgi:hypothetical protein